MTGRVSGRIAPRGDWRPPQPICRYCLHFSRDVPDADVGICKLPQHAGQGSLIPREGGERKGGNDSCSDFTPYAWRGYE